MDGRTVYCAAVYLDINLTVRLQKFVQLLEFCDSKRIPLIVGADSSVHNVLWGCEETNKRGEEIEELILRFNLNVANSSGEYTFSTSRANSIIDITLQHPTVSSQETGGCSQRRASLITNTSLSSWGSLRKRLSSLVNLRGWTGRNSLREWMLLSPPSTNQIPSRLTSTAFTIYLMSS